MNANQSIAAQQPRFSVAISTETYQKLIASTIADTHRRARFVTAITSAVAVNPALQKCTPATILSGALLGESLNLSPSPQLGHYYLVPFDDKKNNVTNAQFILGYKGLIQLAIRSGQYKNINVMEVKQGELVKYDPFTEEFEARFTEDAEEREKLPTIGYVAMFEYHNGFRKVLYWTKKQMLVHADRYSKAFSALAKQKLDNGEIPQGEMWKYSSFWYKDFDAMAKKTMLRQLISKWGIMSIEMQDAFDRDNTIADMNGTKIEFSPAEEQEVVIEPATGEVSEAPQSVNLNDL